ncbi:MAG: FAD-dependent oxidoreductase, partial [Caulobacterales bacterium]
KEVLPFPYILGLTCPAPCQEVCRRGLVEEEIAICRMHGFAAEQVMEDPPVPWVKEAPTGKRIAVIGAGPSGLTAAYYLALLGHYVKVFDMMPQAGGMLRYGIPEYRLPKDMVDKEFDGVWKLGVDAQYNVKLGSDFTLDDLEKAGFDATLLAIGAWTSNELGLEGQDNPGVVNAISYLMDKTQGLPVPVDDTKEVVVLGGGFTTFDCTRTSLRLGAKVHTVYRRGRGEMSATTEEVDDGENEGTDLQLFGAATKLVFDGDKLTGIEIQKMQLGEPDASGRRRPVPVPGSEYTVACDTVIPAYGQKPDKAVLPPESGVTWTKWQSIETDPYNFMTARKGVFAAGDCQIGAATIIEGVAQGKLAARAIDSYLQGDDMAAVSKRIEAEERKPDLFDIVPYKPVEPKVKMPMVPSEERKRSFRLTVLGYTQEQAVRVAGRCLQCACPAAG